MAACYDEQPTLIALAAPCVRSTLPPTRVCSAGSSASYFWRISYKRCKYTSSQPRVQIGITFSRRPSWGASTVMNRALIPRFSACFTIRCVDFLSVLTYLRTCTIKLHRRQASDATVVTYSCIHCGWPGWAASTISSKPHDAKVGICEFSSQNDNPGTHIVHTIWTTPCFPAALVKLSSPSGWPSFPSAVAVCSGCQVTYMYIPNRIAYDVDWHRRHLSEYCCWIVNFCNIAHDSWSEPYSKVLNTVLASC